MVDKEELKNLLRDLRSEAYLPRVKEKAKQLLKNVDPKVLSFAEQELIQEGMDPEELRKLCEVHLKVLSIKEKKPEMEPTHPISILKEEHAVILENLEVLEETMKRVNASESFERIGKELKEIERIAHILIDAEKHHQREEEALFPPLEERGITGPPRIMRMEHRDLRERKKALRRLVDEYETLNYNDFVKRLRELAGYIVPNLRAHISKENNILYPTALKSLEEKQWEAMKEKFDAIGYCCFTPGRGEDIKNLDLTNIPPSERHEKIFGMWNGLKEGQTLRIINDHDPKPLYYQFEAEQKGLFEWEYEQKRPKIWIVRIKNIGKRG
jgi:hypothetical protein